MDEDDIDIYEDLPSFETKDSLANKELSEKCLKFEGEIATLKTKLESSEKSRNIMAGNLSSLMKTAKAEIARKDRMIAQLRRDLDNLTFRRGGHGVRNKRFNNRTVCQESDKSTMEVPLVKVETSGITACSDLSEEEADDFGETYQQDKVVDTLFGERLRKRIMLEEEAERAQKQVTVIAPLEKFSKVQKDKSRKNGDANEFFKKETTLQDTRNGAAVKEEIPDASSVKNEIGDGSAVDDSKPHRNYEKNACYRGEGKRKLFNKTQEALVKLAHGNGRPQEERYRRDESRYNFESLENYDHSRITSKYTDRHREESIRHRDESWRVGQIREGRSESIHRSRSTDRRYNEKQSDRNYTDRSRDYKDEKRRDDRRCKEDDYWNKCKKETMTDLRDLRDRIKSKSRDRNYQMRSCKSRSLEKSRSRSSGRSRRSRSTDRLISVNSTIEMKEDAPKRRSQDSKDSKAVALEPTDVKPKSSSEPLSDSIRKDETNEKTSCQMMVNGTIPKATGQNDGTARSSNGTSGELPIDVLENDSKEALIASTIPETETELASRSCREEEIENIEKFIKDYREIENPWPPIANGESTERDKSCDSTASIVDALSMDIEELPLDKKSDNLITDNPPDTSTLNTEDVAVVTQSQVSLPSQTLIDEENSRNEREVSQVSEVKSVTEKVTWTDKVVGKQMKRRPRIPCMPIISRYSRKKPSVLTDSDAAQRIVDSESSKQNISADYDAKVAMEKSGAVQPIENITDKTDSHTVNGKQIVDDSNNFTDKNSNLSISSEITNNPIDDDSHAREDTNNHRNDKLDNVDVQNVPVELRETRSTSKSIIAAVSSTDGKLSNRKRGLPKEEDAEPKLSVKQCKIVVTVRRRRRIQLEDSCTATTLVPSCPDDDALWNKSSNSIYLKGEKLEPSRFVSEATATSKKRSPTDK